jgi:hypothetical protein
VRRRSPWRARLTHGACTHALQLCAGHPRSRGETRASPTLCSSIRPRELRRPCERHPPSSPYSGERAGERGSGTRHPTVGASRRAVGRIPCDSGFPRPAESVASAHERQRDVRRRAEKGRRTALSQVRRPAARHASSSCAHGVAEPLSPALSPAYREEGVWCLEHGASERLWPRDVHATDRSRRRHRRGKGLSSERRTWVRVDAGAPLTSPCSPPTSSRRFCPLRTSTPCRLCRRLCRCGRRSSTPRRSLRSRRR